MRLKGIAALAAAGVFPAQVTLAAYRSLPYAAARAFARKHFAARCVRCEAC